MIVYNSEHNNFVVHSKNTRHIQSEQDMATQLTLAILFVPSLL
jgi:hypothetical protein